MNEEIQLALTCLWFCERLS